MPQGSPRMSSIPWHGLLQSVGPWNDRLTSSTEHPRTVAHEWPPIPGGLLAFFTGFNQIQQFSLKIRSAITPWPFWMFRYWVAHTYLLESLILIFYSHEVKLCFRRFVSQSKKYNRKYTSDEIIQLLSTTSAEVLEYMITAIN